MSRPESLRFFSEWLPSAGVLAVYVWPLSAAVVAELTAAAVLRVAVASASPARLSLTWTHADTETVISTITMACDAGLPVNAAPQRVQWQRHDATVHVRLHYAPTAIPLSAVADDKLSLWQAQRIVCRVCAAPLRDDAASVAPFQRIAHLPSDTWHEWKDLWVCACTRHMLASSEIMRALPTDAAAAFSARAGTLLVGTHHLLLHPSDLSPTCYTVDHAVLFQEKKQRWERILCARCLSPLGRRSPSAASPDSPDIMLEKHRITTAPAPEGPTPVALHSAETLLATMLLQAVHAHAAYHFLIREHVFMSPRLWISVVAWNVSVSIAADTPHTRALSILYCDNETAAQKSSYVLRAPRHLCLFSFIRCSV